MRISDWSSDVCSSDLIDQPCACDQLRQHHRHGLKRLDLHILVTARLDMLDAEHANRLLAAHDRNARKAVEVLFPRFRPVFEIRMRPRLRSEEHTSELQSLMRISNAVFCLKNKTHYKQHS